MLEDAIHAGDGSCTTSICQSKSLSSSLLSLFVVTVGKKEKTSRENMGVGGRPACSAVRSEEVGPNGKKDMRESIIADTTIVYLYIICSIFLTRKAAAAAAAGCQEQVEKIMLRNKNENPFLETRGFLWELTYKPVQSYQ